MSGKQIGIIYFYLVSAGSLVLIVIGIFTLFNLIVNLTLYDKYPLPYGIENCEMYPPQPYGGKGPVPAIDGSVPAPSTQDMEAAKEQCRAQAALERQQNKVNNVRDTFAYLFIGILLFGIHFPQARKQSK